MLYDDFTYVGDDASTQVKVFTEPSFMELAVEQFLGKSEEDVKVGSYKLDLRFIWLGETLQSLLPPKDLYHRNKFQLNQNP